MTGQELLNASGRLLLELRGGRSFDAQESALFLVSLNQMLASWSQEQWAIYQIARETLALSGASSYTMGPAATLNTTRPIRITAAEVLATSGLRKPAEIITAERWATILDDSMTGDFAEVLFPDYGFTQVTLRVWPKPGSGTLILYSLKPLTAIAALGDTVSFPPGYEEALIYGLACKIAPEFGKQAPDHVIAIAEKAKAAIAATNAQILAQTAPPAPEVAA